jgi:hypothetical protein
MRRLHYGCKRFFCYLPPARNAITLWKQDETLWQRRKLLQTHEPITKPHAGKRFQIFDNDINRLFALRTTKGTYACPFHRQWQEG